MNSRTRAGVFHLGVTCAEDPVTWMFVDHKYRIVTGASAHYLSAFGSSPSMSSAVSASSASIDRVVRLPSTFAYSVGESPRSGRRTST